MAFNFNISNIGKLTDARLQVGQFTVFAGPNNTGKSFVSRILYSLFDAVNANHAGIYVKNITRTLSEKLHDIQRYTSGVDWPSLALLSQEMLALEQLVAERPDNGIPGLSQALPRYIEKIIEIQDVITNTRASLQYRKENGPPLNFPDSEYHVKEPSSADVPYNLIDSGLENMERSLNDLQETFRRQDAAEKIIISAIGDKFTQNLVQNFQTPKLSDLIDKNNPLEVTLQGIGKFCFSDGKISVSIDESGLFRLQQYSNVIYLESPIYWKLKNALEDIQLYPRHTHRTRERLSGVAEYFYDLAAALKFEYTGDMAFPEVYEKLTDSTVIGGKIALSESGDLSFQEDGRNFSLPLTAMGIANLGILALLIERKVLDKGSLLFIDEPEAHLHPAWQVIAAESLFELAKRGANVVIATHSADILKWLEVHVKKHPEDESLIALNKFPPGGSETEEQDFSDKIAAIKEELTRPFADLYTAGL